MHIFCDNAAVLLLPTVNRVLICRMNVSVWCEYFQLYICTAASSAFTGLTVRQPIFMLCWIRIFYCIYCKI